MSSTLNRGGPAPTVEALHRRTLVIWAAMLASLGTYFALAYALRPEPPAGATANDSISLALLCAGAAFVLASFIVKNRLLSRAVAEQNARRVVSAYVVGMALAEAAGVLGLASSFVLGGGFPDLLFLVAGVGLLLHFPRGEDFHAARHVTEH
jgi:F0F1-type ATP synthase membrane subunit c/vacuolar-type H+-ATPase subunit K